MTAMLLLGQVDALRQRRASGEAITSLMRAYGLSKTSVYRYLAQVPSVDAEAAD
jgi:Helix-turn-helix domain of resolvase